MFQLCAYLFEDERGVAITDERMKQLLRIAQKKTVCLFVQLAYFLFDAAKQAQLTEMAFPV